MGKSYLPDRESDLLGWANAFLPVASTNKVALGLSVADITNLTSDAAAFGSALISTETAKNAYHAAVQNKDEVKTTLLFDVRDAVDRIQANKSVPIGLKKELGITPHDGTRTTTPPTQPLDLVAIANADGTNALKWKANGNKATTSYVVEAMIGAALSFAYIGSTTKTKFDHTNQTPGVKVTYRVTATRADESSIPSDIAVVYSSAPGLVLDKAA